MKRYVLFIGFLFCLESISAQTLLKGIIMDQQQQVLDGATLQLKRAKDSALLRQTRSTRQGFQFRRVAAGAYLLQVQFLGFAVLEKNLLVMAGDSLLDFGALMLQPATDSSLVSVVVKASIPPVLVKKDTLVFNASAYKVGPNATVQELLKRLPGVEVDKEGNVSVQGQKVEKIYVDGKEFLLSDPKLLTKEFPADMLAAVEAFDHASEESRFSGVKDWSGTKALNFRMKKEMRHVLVGKLYGAVGTEGRYSVGAGLQELRPEKWLSIGGNSNTVNDLFRGFQELPRQTGGSGDKKSHSAQVNYRNRLSKKITAGFSYQFSDHSNQLQRSSVRRDFLSDSVLNRRQDNRQLQKQLEHQFQGDLQWQMDSMQSLVLRPSFQLQRRADQLTDSSVLFAEKNNQTNLINQVQRMQNEKVKQQRWGISLSYRRRFTKPGRSLVFNLQYGATTDKSGRLLLNRTLYQNIHQQSVYNRKGHNEVISVFYTEPIAKGNILDFQYAYQPSGNNSQRNSYDFDPATGNYTRYDSLTSNAFSFASNSHRLAAGYNLVRPHIRYQFGMGGLYTLQDNQVLSGNGKTIQQSTLNWMPRASMQIELSQQSQLTLRYNGRSQQPTADQLQPLVDPTNPLLIKTGNAALRPAFFHNWQMSFVKADRKKTTYLMADLQLNLTTNKITSSTLILPGGVQQQQLININGVYSVSASVNYSIPVMDKTGMLRLGQRIRLNRDKSLMNAQENIQEQMGIAPFVQLRFEPLVGLTLEGETHFDYSTTNYSLNDRKVELLRSHYGLNLRYELPGGLILQSDLSMDVNPAQAGLPSNQVTLWNSMVSKYFLANRQAELRLSAFDLLDQNKGIQQLAGEQFIEQSRVNMQQQLWLLSFVWNFKKAGT